jgi:tripartite-type tricarboxylate transporter receptor subunit TctC
MNMRVIRWSVLTCVALAAAGPVGLAQAQGYPGKPIRIVVPFPPGGGTDIVARILTQKLSESFGANFVIDNRAGAGGSIGTEMVAKAPPDGYTLGIVSGSHAINPSLYSKLPFDAVRDFAPVTMLVSGPGLLVVHPSLPVKTVKELIALAKGKPGQLNYASAGNGTPPHLAGELFKSMAGVDLVHVPYKGNTPAFVDLISGQVSLSFPTIPSALPHVQAGRLRALAVTSRKRSAVMPQLPTIAESGLPGYDTSSWFGMLAPAGTPREIVRKLQQESAKVLQLRDVREKLLSQGLEPVGSTPEEFAATIESEIAKWAKVVKASGARVE